MEFMVNLPIHLHMTSSGNPFGNYEFQAWLNFSCGNLALTLYPPDIIYVRERFRTKSCAQYESELVIHMLCECLSTNDVWGEEDSPLKKWKVDCQDIEDLWLRIVDKLPNNNQHFCAIFLKNLWLRRNAFIFENKFMSPKMLIHNASQQLDGF